MAEPSKPYDGACRQVRPAPEPEQVDVAPESPVYLTREAILGAVDLPVEAVDMRPYWPGTVCVRSFSARDRSEFEREAFAARDGDGMDMRGLKERIVVLTVVGDDGTLLFDADDVEALNAKSGAAVDRIWQVAARLNHLLGEDMERLVGNSAGDRGADSPSS